MKKYIILFFVLASIISFGQEESKSNHFTINASYPITVGNNSYNYSMYKGLYSLDLGYNLDIKNNSHLCFNIGQEQLISDEMSFNYQLDSNVSVMHTMPPINLNVLTASIGLKKMIGINKLSIIPQVNIGYSLFKQSAKQGSTIQTNNNSAEKTEDITNMSPSSYDAITLSTSLKMYYNSSKRTSVGLSVGYDHTIFNKYNYQTPLQLIKPGVEVRIKI